MAHVGNIAMGHTSPITVQSMTNVHTHEIDGCVRQIGEMVENDCELVRLAVPTQKDTEALCEIIKQVDVPIIADVHFHFERALEAIAAGVHKIRLNPGNISERQQVVKVIDACKANNVAIRVGVNEGSIVERKDQHRRNRELRENTTELMLEKMTEYVHIFEDNNFDNLVLSAKCHDAAGTIAVNRAVSQRFDYPMHLGVTHAGDIQTGAIRSAAALGALLAEGIGDTIRVSLASDPIEEIGVAWEILNSLGLRKRRRPELIACPTCGRTEINLLEMVERVKPELAKIKYPLTVAIMGCVVNGPGEADGADIALCGGKNHVVIYKAGEKVATVKADEAIDALMTQIREFVAEKQL